LVGQLGVCAEALAMPSETRAARHTVMIKPTRCIVIVLS
jgi:hypothetical protein